MDRRDGKLGGLEIPDNPLRQAREGKGLSISQLAAMSGVQKVTIELLECGRTTPRPHTVMRLGQVLGIGAEVLANDLLLWPGFRPTWRVRADEGMRMRALATAEQLSRLEADLRNAAGEEFNQEIAVALKQTIVQARGLLNLWACALEDGARDWAKKILEGADEACLMAQSLATLLLCPVKNVV
jgi:transcriptional regulator with XRE-family HTH domain